MREIVGILTILGIRYTLYNARIDFILGERERLVVLSRREKMYFSYSIFPCDIFDFRYSSEVLLRFAL